MGMPIAFVARQTARRRQASYLSVGTDRAFRDATRGTLTGVVRKAVGIEPTPF